MPERPARPEQPGAPWPERPARPDYFAVDFNLTPYVVAWETTRACDLSCTHCPGLRTAAPSHRRADHRGRDAAAAARRAVRRRRRI